MYTSISVRFPGDQFGRLKYLAISVQFVVCIRACHTEKKTSNKYIIYIDTNLYTTLKTYKTASYKKEYLLKAVNDWLSKSPENGDFWKKFSIENLSTLEKTARQTVDPNPLEGITSMESRFITYHPKGTTIFPMITVYRGWQTTQLYRDYFIRHDKDPYYDLSTTGQCQFAGFSEETYYVQKNWSHYGRP